MPNPDNMMIVRPKNCQYCGNGYYGLLHAVNYAKTKGWNVIDISGEQANKEPIYEALDEYDPIGFYGFGHGKDDMYTADSEEPVFTTEECDKLSGRVVYLLSCLCGSMLGPEIIRQGALAFAGFNISWTWVSEKGTDGDPYDDRYAKGFWESGNELWLALCDGEEFLTAVQSSIDMYDAWIDYWYEEAPEDPYSQECIKWLAFDRDGLVALNYCMLIQMQEECEAAGCYWYDDVCNSRFETPKQSILPLIPIIAIIGLALIVGQTKKKPTKKRK